jgi:hypothetical protein
MPTTLERLTITRVPRVERLIQSGQTRYPGTKPAEAILRLAEETAAKHPQPRSAGLRMLPMNATFDMQALEQALLEDD